MSNVMRLDLPRVIELELWSPPALAQGRDGHSVADLCRLSLGLNREVVLGLSSVPDHIDSQNLQTAILEGELLLSDFTEFCEANSLDPNPDCVCSACRFLAHAYGSRLAWVHIPAKGEGIAEAQRINQWARSEGLCLVEPHLQYCLLPGAPLADLLPPDA